MFWQDARDVCLFIFVVLVGIAGLILVLFGVVYGISAFVDSTWDCPPNNIVVYNDMGFKSACYSTPSVTVNYGSNNG